MATFLRTAARSRSVLSRSFAQPASRMAPTALRRHYASAAASAVAAVNEEQAFFPDEPTAPIVKTQIPGPESSREIERLGKIFDTRSLNMMANYQQSYGN
jgi:4-aminobutyrate aminotransferase/(S)-3-amino-2-methylpropionate transaminase